MENFLGISVVLFLQHLGEGLRPLMSFFTFLGTEEFILVFVPALYWCVDAALGLRLGVLLFVSSILGDSVKILLHSPRPFWVSTRVQAWSVESSFGLPSLHAQNAVVLWGTLGIFLRRAWGWVLMGLLIFFVSISRLYLGVHFPQDILLGWVLGALLLFLASAGQPAFERFMRLPQWKRMLAAGLFSLGLVVLGAASSMYTAVTWPVPSAWLKMFAQNAPGADFNPLDVRPFFSLGGALFGLSMGGLWLHERGGFSPDGSLRLRVQRYLLGIVVTVALWAGLKVMFPDGALLIDMLFRSLRYALVGMWVAAGAPLVFLRLGWANPRGEAKP